MATIQKKTEKILNLIKTLKSSLPNNNDIWLYKYIRKNIKNKEIIVITYNACGTKVIYEEMLEKYEKYINKFVKIVNESNLNKTKLTELNSMDYEESEDEINIGREIYIELGKSQKSFFEEFLD
jgi:hypothetical protein